MQQHNEYSIAKPFLRPYQLQKRQGDRGKWETVYQAWKREKCEQEYTRLKKEGKLP